MKMSSYKNLKVMSGAGMDNQDALSLAVRLYGPENFSGRCLEVISRESLFPTKKGKCA